VPDTPRTSPVNLVEVSNRAWKARHIIAGFSLVTPSLTQLWRQVDDALSDILVLTAEIAHLHDRLIASRIDRANLAAAGRVTLTAYCNGEPDPLACLRDELHAQGFRTQLPAREDT
jgi:hypothetical protein